MKNNYIAIGFVIIVVLLVFGLSFLYKNDSQYEQEEETVDTSSGVITNTESVDEMEEYADWVQYIDEENKIVFSHPEDLSVIYTAGADFDTYKIGDGITIKVYPYSEASFNKFTKDFEKEIDISDTTGITYSEILINQTFGIKGYRLNHESSGPYFATLFNVGDMIFRVDATGEGMAVIEGVLFTLNFND